MSEGRYVLGRWRPGRTAREIRDPLADLERLILQNIRHLHLTDNLMVGLGRSPMDESEHYVVIYRKKYASSFQCPRHPVSAASVRVGEGPLGYRITVDHNFLAQQTGKLAAAIGEIKLWACRDGEWRGV